MGISVRRKPTASGIAQACAVHLTGYNWLHTGNQSIRSQSEEKSSRGGNKDTLPQSFRNSCLRRGFFLSAFSARKSSAITALLVVRSFPQKNESTAFEQSRPRLKHQSINVCKALPLDGILLSEKGRGGPSFSDFQLKK